MHDETPDRDPFGADAPLPGPGPDPFDAVAAVAAPRREAENDSAAADGPNAAGDAGLLTDNPGERDAENAEAGAPLYDGIEWPEGYVADPEAMARFVPLAKRLGLSREAAQELARLYADLDGDRNRLQAEFIARNNAEWLREIQAHPEFGGRRLGETGEQVAATLRRYGSPLLVAQIRQMNVQNWPEMFYFLARVSRAASEDRSPSGSGDAAVKSTAQLLFPDLN